MLFQTGTSVELYRFIPEYFVLTRFGHVQCEYVFFFKQKTAFEMRIVRTVHQDVVAEQIGHRVGDSRALMNLGTLEITPACRIFAGFVAQLRNRVFYGFCMFVYPRQPEWQPAMARL